MQYVEYNGYTNYETWLAQFWASNDQGAHEMIGEAARSAADDWEGDDDEVRNAAIDAMQAALGVSDDSLDEQRIPTQGFLADMINTALAEVDWSDAVGCYVEEAITSWKADNEPAPEDEPAASAEVKP